MNNLFNENNTEAMEQFEIIFENAPNEEKAKHRAVNFYIDMIEDGHEIDMDEVVDMADNYDYDFSNFAELVNERL